MKGNEPIEEIADAAGKALVSIVVTVFCVGVVIAFVAGLCVAAITWALGKL